MSPANELAFKMNANAAGLDIPFSIAGTTADPKFVPDVKGMASGVAGGMLQQALQGNKANPGQATNPLEGLTGLFKKKKPK